MCDDSLRLCPYQFIYSGTATMPTTGNERSVEVRGSFTPNGWNMGAPMSFDGTKWSVTVNIPWAVQTLYKFYIVDSMGNATWLADPNNPNTQPDGDGGTNSVLSGITCENYTCNPAQPMCGTGVPADSYDWRDAIMYFVFVDRFLDGDTSNDNPSTDTRLDPSTNWQGGDWAGVTQKIQSGYFNQLGVNALWITVPMGQSSSVGEGVLGDTHYYTAYHGYWPADLEVTEPRFGTQTDFQGLVTAAHTAGLKVLIDYSMHAVHQDSMIWQMHMTDGWFNPWVLPSGDQCLCGSDACPWDGPTGITCWFAPYLPAFNFTNAAARAYSVGNAMSWIQNNNADGFRLDAIKQVDPSWLTDLRNQLNTQVEPVTKQHVYLVGETFSGDQNLIKSFVDPCTMLDGQFDFPLRAQILTNLLLRQGQMQDLRGFMDSNDGFYGTGLMSTFLGNADVPRTIHYAMNTPIWTDPWADGKEGSNFPPNTPALVPETEAYERMSVAMALLYTGHGIPLVYYGDEIGMPGAGDPDNRRFMNWEPGTFNAGQQLLLSNVQKLGAIRGAHTGLRHGTRTTLSIASDTWVYMMSDGVDTVYVALNRSDSDQTVSGLPSGSLSELLSGTMVTGPSVVVPARTALILTLP
jgi:glycosidase